MASVEFGCLVRLMLDVTTVDDDAVSALSKSTVVSRIETLDLSNTKVTSEGLKAIASSKEFKDLARLGLAGTEIDDVGVFSLSFSKHHKKLQALNFAKTKVTGKGVIVVGRSKELLALTELKCDGSQIETEDLGVFLGEEHRLKLVFTTNDQRDERVLQLNSQPTSLDLSCTDLGDKFIEILSSSRLLTNLEKIDVSQSKISPRGLISLGKSKQLLALKEVKCGSIQITGDDLEAFVREPEIRATLVYGCEDGKVERKLQMNSRPTLIDFSRTLIGDKVMEVLSTSIYVSSLEKPEVSNTVVTEKES